MYEFSVIFRSHAGSYTILIKEAATYELAIQLAIEEATKQKRKFFAVEAIEILR